MNRETWGPNSAADHTETQAPAVEDAIQELRDIAQGWRNDDSGKRHEKSLRDREGVIVKVVASLVDKRLPDPVGRDRLADALDEFAAHADGILMARAAKELSARLRGGS